MKWANKNNEIWFNETTRAIQDYHQQIEDYLAGTLLVNPGMTPDDFTFVTMISNQDLPAELEPKAIKEFRLTIKSMGKEEKILERKWLFKKKDLE